MSAKKTNDERGEPNDALDLLSVQNKIISDLFDGWDAKTQELKRGDSVDARWERGSTVKLLLQHLAVRESAKQDVCDRLAFLGHETLGAKLEGHGVQRRQRIARLDELVRGMVGMNANNPEVDGAVLELEQTLRQETSDEANVLEAAQRELGPSGQRDLASPKYVRTHSPTHPSPVPKWHDRIGPLKALRALYDHLRGSPSGATAPGLDEAREQTPGIRPNEPTSDSE